MAQELSHYLMATFAERLRASSDKVQTAQRDAGDSERNPRVPQVSSRIDR